MEKNRFTVALSLVSSLRLCLCSGVAPVYSSGQAPGLGEGCSSEVSEHTELPKNLRSPAGLSHSLEASLVELLGSPQMMVISGNSPLGKTVILEATFATTYLPAPFTQ